ncbi:MAG: hypothetical protein HRU24_14730 [Gammaproteobacteria bacterium]|nr:hypothetical protein [Gammaproteobacteria bacterium]
MKIIFLVLLFFSSHSLANPEIFHINDGNKIQQIIIGFLKENSKLMMQRSGIKDLIIVPCSYQGSSKAIRVCTEHRFIKPQNGILTYSVQQQSYAYLIRNVLPAIKRVLVIDPPSSQLATLLNDLGIMTTSIHYSNMRELVKAMDLPGQFDAVVFGVNHGMGTDTLKENLSFLAKQRLIVFTADPTELSLGATIAIAPSQDEILGLFTNILQFYKVTGILKSSPAVCVGSVRVNKRAARALNLDLSPARLATLKNNLRTACL